ncbi:MAG: phage portal protein [Patescibacteria group bacterium]
MEINIRPTIKQHLANEALKGKDIVFLGGGAGGGKSWWLCESRLINCYLHPGYRSFIGREELKRLMQSTYITWCKVCEYHKIPKDDWHLNGQYNYIQFKNGSRIDLLDLKFIPSDPLYERLGSLEYTDGAIDETGEIHFLAYDMLKTRIGRHKNREFNLRPTLALTGNPKKNWTYLEFYKPFKRGELPNNIAFIQSLYYDNPHTAEDYKKQLSQIRDKITKQRLMLGIWEYEEGDNCLMRYEAITDLFTNSVLESNEKFLIGDIARFGRDKTVIMLWKGYKCYKILVWQKQGLDVTQEKIKELLIEEMIPYSHCLIDEEGVGGGIVDNLRGIKGFVANSSPIHKTHHKTHNIGERENYRNLKTQCAYILSEMVNTHQMAIEYQDMIIKEQIIEELEQIKRKDPDSDSKLQIIPKDEVKEILQRSPDFGDCILMRMYFKICNIGESLYSQQKELNFYKRMKKKNKKEKSQRKIGVSNY